MEEETRRAQEAKFRDLIRQGGPENLQEANRLAKILSGYDQRDKEKFRMKAADEIIRIQEEAKLLEERLQNFRPGDDMADGDVFEEVANSLMSEQPKLLKISKQESGDEEAVQRIKGLVENIDRTIERYRLMKAGDIVGANRIAQGAFGGDAPTSAAGKQEELSLIDFDSGQSNGASSGVPEHGSSMEDDLLGLSMQEPASAQNGGLGPLFLGSDSTSLTQCLPKICSSNLPCRYYAYCLLPNNFKLDSVSALRQPPSSAVEQGSSTSVVETKLQCVQSFPNATNWYTESTCTVACAELATATGTAPRPFNRSLRHSSIRETSTICTVITAPKSCAQCKTTTPTSGTGSSSQLPPRSRL